jgi:hypothetical protein
MYFEVENQITNTEICHDATLSVTDPCGCTSTSAVKNWSLTTSAMARQYTHLFNTPQIKISLKVFVESQWSK